MRFVIPAMLLGLSACQAPEPSPSQTSAHATQAKAARVVAREYKVLLDPAPFGADPEAAVAALDDEVKALIDDALDRDRKGTLDEIDALRTVRFLDVPGDCALRNSAFILRERIEDDERELTLKFRSPDRYVAGAANVSSSADGAETKLEEDITPGYASVFSRATTIELASNVALEEVGDAVDIFPGLAVDLDPRAPLATVAALEVEERVYGPLEVDLGKHDAEIELTLWFTGSEEPAVAELSFKYKSKTEAYDPVAVRRGMQLFELLQALDWAAPDSTTKTASVYELDPAFCAP